MFRIEAQQALLENGKWHMPVAHGTDAGQAALHALRLSKCRRGPPRRKSA